MNQEDLKEIVREKYAGAALRVASGGSAGCGSASPCGERDPVTLPPPNLHRSENGRRTRRLIMIYAWVCRGT